jgi:hypothetical protein
VRFCTDDGRKFRRLYTKGNIMPEQEYCLSLKNAKHMSKLTSRLI